jgi:hypothetical protein
MRTDSHCWNLGTPSISDRSSNALPAFLPAACGLSLR